MHVVHGTRQRGLEVDILGESLHLQLLQPPPPSDALMAPVGRMRQRAAPGHYLVGFVQPAGGSLWPRAVVVAQLLLPRGLAFVAAAPPARVVASLDSGDLPEPAGDEGRVVGRLRELHPQQSRHVVRVDHAVAVILAATVEILASRLCAKKVGGRRINLCTQPAE